MPDAVNNYATPRIIVHGAIVDNDWALLRVDVADGDTAPAPDAIAVPAGKVIVPLAVWSAQRARLAPRAAAGEIGVWLASDERPEVLKGEVGQFAVIAVDFPKFTDGRGYSIAYNLRMRLGYTGQLRAIGDVLRDQLFALRRVGFDAFATRPDRSIDDALKGLSVFSEVYQASVDEKAPLFRRHLRDVRTQDHDVGYGI